MAAKKDTIYVQIQCNQLVHYTCTVEMSRKEWEKTKKITSTDMEDESVSPLTDILDNDDIDEWYDFYDVEMTVVDENGDEVEGEEGYVSTRKERSEE